MAWLRWVLVGGLALTVACGDDGGDTDTADVDMAAPDMGTDAFTEETDAFTEEADAFTEEADAFVADEDGGSTAGALDTFETDVATAKCAALFRCCDADSRTEFFGQYECFGGLTCPYEDQQEMIPPADMAACVTLMEALDEVTFGAWLTEARAGRVGFDPVAHQACLDDLSTAACGDELTAALYDATCFARTAGTVFSDAQPIQHASFERTAGVGDDCVTFFEEPYGSCDPEVAFCCVGGAGSCTTGGEGGQSGTCVAASDVGESCTQFPDQLCEAGLECQEPSAIGETSTCAAPTTPPALDEGDACLSESFESLGECMGSYCDSDTRQCEPTLANGETCSADPECTSGNCAVTSGGGPFVTRECADPTFCIGS